MPRYIVVRKLERPAGKEKYRTSKRPKPHNNKDSAIAEAIRLAEKEKSAFSIFEEIGTILPLPDPVSK